MNILRDEFFQAFMDLSCMAWLKGLQLRLHHSCTCMDVTKALINGQEMKMNTTGICRDVNTKEATFTSDAIPLLGIMMSGFAPSVLNVTNIELGLILPRSLKVSS